MIARTLVITDEIREMMKNGCSGVRCDECPLGINETDDKDLLCNLIFHKHPLT